MTAAAAVLALAVAVAIVGFHGDVNVAAALHDRTLTLQRRGVTLTLRRAGTAERPPAGTVPDLKHHGIDRPTPFPQRGN